MTAQLAYLSALFLRWWEVSFLICVYADSSFFFLSKLSCPELVWSAVWRLKKVIVFSLEHLFCFPGLAWISVNGLHQHISLLWSLFFWGRGTNWREFTASHLRYHFLYFNKIKFRKTKFCSEALNMTCGLLNLGVSRLWLNFHIWVNIAFKADFGSPQTKVKKKVNAALVMLPYHQTR